MNRVKYVIQVMERTLYAADGDERSHDRDPWSIWEGDDLEEAKNRLEEALEDSDYTPTIQSTRYGIGSITYWDIDLLSYEESYVDEDGDYVFESEPETIDSWNTLTDELKAAWAFALQSYRDYLDYQDDCFYTLAHALELMNKEERP